MSDERWDHLNRQSEYGWEKIVGTPLGKLKLAEALLARYDTYRDQGDIGLAEKREHLKSCVGALLREADAAEVLADYHVRRLVLRLFSAAGLRRLETRSLPTQEAA